MLEIYLWKYRFCIDCKNKVFWVYNIFIGEFDCSKEKGYCVVFYEGLWCCLYEWYIYVCCEIDFIVYFLGCVELEFVGGWRERYVKIIDIV